MSQAVHELPHMADTQAPPAIVLDKVNKWFGTLHVLRDVSLTVAREGARGGVRAVRLRQVHHDPLHQPAGDRTRKAASSSTAPS